MIKNLISNQVKCGYRSSCVIYYSDDGYCNWILKECEIYSIDIHLIKVRKSRSTRLMLFFNHELSKYINSRCVDKQLELFLTFHDAHFSATCLPFNLRCKSNSLVVFHGCPNGLFHSNVLMLLIHWFFNLILVFSKTLLVVVSNKDIELIRKRLYLPQKRFITIYNGVPSAVFRKRDAGKKEFVVGFIGSLDARKQWWIAVDAIKVANTKSSNIFLKIAGDGPDRTLLLEKITSNGDYYRYLGNVSDPISNFYQDVDLIVMTSALEGLPMVILESFSLGIPVISTAVGGVPEIITSGYNGYLIDQDAILIGERIAYLSNNPSLMVELSKNALSTFNEKFTIEKCSDNYINAFLVNRNND